MYLTCACSHLSSHNFNHVRSCIAFPGSSVWHHKDDWSVVWAVMWSVGSAQEEPSLEITPIAMQCVFSSLCTWQMLSLSWLSKGETKIVLLKSYFKGCTSHGKLSMYSLLHTHRSHALERTQFWLWEISPNSAKFSFEKSMILGLSLYSSISQLVQ